MISRSMILLAAVGLAATGCMQTSAAYPQMEIDPIVVGPPGSSTLAAANFLAGCWRGATLDGVGVYEERWSPAAAGIMLGTSRMFAGARLGSFEFLTIRATEEGIDLLPAPNGRPSPAVFALTESRRGSLLFEDPDHDFPRRIGYSVDGRTLTIRVDGGAADADPLIWTLERVDCAD